MSRADAPIGVFDSGVGGLTVLAALRAALPHERFVYLGDTARVPYGTKSPDSVVRYSLQATATLVACGVKAVVVACNTASAVAIEPLRAAHPALPVHGVIGPGARAAVAASRARRIAVIATEGTVRGGAYQRAIHALDPAVVVRQQACALLVALAEEGWTTGKVVDDVLERYLDPLFGAAVPAADRPDALVLGCTHFPPFAATIAARLGGGVAVVDSAATTAHEMSAQLAASGLRRAGGEGAARFLVTDGPERFARVARVFLGQALDAAAVETVDL